MADSKLTSIIKKGVEPWNHWRKRHYDINPDLSEAKLSGLNLDEIDLSKAVLSGADLSFSSFLNAKFDETMLDSTNLTNALMNGASITDASLESANLFNANLFQANLENSSLYGADLIKTNLTEANLEDTDLTDANLIGANLTRANFSNAVLDNTTFGETIFADTDLSNVKRILTCRHESPSVVDHRTLIKSLKLAKEFLLGCGMSNHFIKCYSTTLKETDNYYSCFISYSSEDEPFVRKLHKDLSKNGVPCWYAPEDMKIGSSIRKTIVENIKTYDKLILVLSKSSICSRWVEFETENARSKADRTGQDVLFPIRIDNSIINSRRHWVTSIRDIVNIGDFTEWENPQSYRLALKRILYDLRIDSSR